MIGGGHQRSDEDSLREASEWFARMRAPDADEVRADFDEWRRNPANSSAYAEMEAIWSAAASARPRVAPPRRQKLRPGLIAASLGAAVTIGMLVHQFAGQSASSPATLYRSDIGAIRQVELADGSQMTLDTASEVRTTFDRETRNVTLLNGRARFAVKHDSAHPFVVTAAGHAIIARGTMFDVRIDPGRTEITLIEGAVDLERRKDGGKGTIVGRLRPGETAVFVQSDPRPRVGPSHRDTWASGVLAADGMRLVDLVREAGRYSATPIRLGTPDLEDLKITGGFRPENAEKLAEALAAALGLRVVRGEGGSLTLVRSDDREFGMSCRGEACLVR